MEVLYITSENKESKSVEKMVTEAQVTKISELVQEQNYQPAPTMEKVLSLTRAKASEFIKFLLAQKNMADTCQHNKEQGKLFNESLFHMSRAAARDIMLHFKKDPVVYSIEYENTLRSMYLMDLEIKQRLKDDIARGEFK